MLYIMNDTDKIGTEFLETALPQLSLQRTKRMDELKNKRDKINCAACYLLLRKALHEEYGIKDKPEFLYFEHGKPYIKGHENIHFNFSHCRNACACIVSDKPTAVDIADKRHISLRTAQYFCSDEEFGKISALPSPSDELVRLWSIKECYSKLDGSGLFKNFKEITKECTADIHTFGSDMYYCSYYSPDPLSPIFVINSSKIEAQS